MPSQIKVLGFSGSLRKGSSNTALLRAAVELAPETMKLEIFDLSPLPMYNGDVEQQGMPDAVREFREWIAAADALLIAVPEYNYSIPGALKNAIDWASRPTFGTQPPLPSPLVDKPFAMMGAGGASGTMRAQFHLRQMAVHNDMHALNKPEIYLARARDKFDAEGNLVDGSTRETIRALLIALETWTRRLAIERPVAG